MHVLSGFNHEGTKLLSVRACPVSVLVVSSGYNHRVTKTRRSSGGLWREELSDGPRI